MSFGIITRAIDGSENFRGEHQTLRVIHHQVIQPSFTGVIPVVGISPYDTVGYCISRAAPTEYGCLFVEIEVGQVRLSRFNNSYAPNVELDLIVLRIR